MIELVATLATLFSIYLTSKNNILCWPIGIIGIVTYSYIFYELNLKADLILQGIFLIQSIFAWISWNKIDNLKPTYLKERGVVMSLTILTYMLIFTITSKLNGSLPFLDSAVTTFSIIAMFLLIFKKIESWIYWIINDLLLIIIFFINGLYLSMFVYLICLTLAIIGLLKWIKDEKI